MKSSIFASAVAASIALASAAFAADEYNVSNGLTLNGMPLGFHGVDVVAMTTGERLLDGAAAHAATHDGVEYYFATAAAKDSFEADPTAFLPQFGGFCTLGVAVNKKLDGNPRFADVRDGKLYVFVNQTIYNKYKEDPVGTITTAEENWKTIQNTAVVDL
ncbi:YHS domain-containing (seleno)protein [Tateyamaria sp.]|uniref:YHS domain-containing (seleno)protein n=1 Tax=Tateyamaria sp. TaxID=1929288 RepID=UPI003B21BD97